MRELAQVSHVWSRECSNGPPRAAWRSSDSLVGVAYYVKCGRSISGGRSGAQSEKTHHVLISLINGDNVRRVIQQCVAGSRRTR